MKWLNRTVLVFLGLIGIFAWLNFPKLTIISGYASKNMASTVFIAHRNPTSIKEKDNNVPLIKWADVKLTDHGASASVFGLMQRETECIEGLGCFLINPGTHLDKTALKPQRNPMLLTLPFPFGNGDPKDTLFANVDFRHLEEAMDLAFSNPAIQKTRTVLVAYKNHIIAERYGDGFNENTPVLGWSMTKSVLATLYGILQYQGKININERAEVESWQNDERKNITLNHLLRMQSGLAWDEDYTSISDVTKMLFLSDNMSLAQAQNESIAPPTEIWNYSSGTTNLLSGLLRNTLSDQQAYLNFPYHELIDKIGMTSMLIETDASGNFVGSSYGWASTRDWAKFGLLYLNHGRWNGEQLFDPEWPAYVSRPTPHSQGTYGAHFWLNAEGKYPDVPRDLYSANGYQGQYVFIIPSKDLVVVRTGLAEEPDFDVNGFLREVIASIQ
ncbi:MAG: class C beta-lactamase-related serine hydrolase [Flavobacteriales bacterium]|nr:MAG: class C beta-lactamase-related serine hydrolase [Flavobacteriales bacterium]